MVLRRRLHRAPPPVRWQQLASPSPEYLAGLERTVSLDVPFEEKELAKRLGARWDAGRCRWTCRARELRRFSRWLPVTAVELGPDGGAGLPVAILGLSDRCWHCGEEGTALAGLLRVGGDRHSDDLVRCDEEVPLALADRYLPEAARADWRVGEIRRRYIEPRRRSYLSNGCASCGALRDDLTWSDGDPVDVGFEESLRTLAVVEIPVARWRLSFIARYR